MLRAGDKAKVVLLLITKVWQLHKKVYEKPTIVNRLWSSGSTLQLDADR